MHTSDTPEPTSRPLKVWEIRRNEARERREKMTDNWIGPIEENTSIIALDKGMFTKVDSSQAEHLNKWNWHVSSHGYVVRFQGNKILRMHSVVSGEFHIDHKNRDKLDNRRSNLRPATTEQNAGNVAKLKSAKTSIFKGVYRRKATGKFVARCRFKYKHVHLGEFTDEREAAMAYDRFARERFGEFALLNFPL